MAQRTRADRRRVARGKQGQGRSLWLWVIVTAVVVGAVGGGVAAFLARPASGPGEIVTEFMHIHGLEVPAWASDELYVSTHEGLIRVDADGVWRYVSEQRHDFMGFSAHPSEPGVLYSSGHPAPGSGLRNPIGFMVSRDGGATWQSLSLQGQADFHAVAVYPGDGDVIYGWNVIRGAEGLYRSTDGGRSWEQQPPGSLAAAGGVFSLAVHPRDADHVLAATQNGLWRSTDGGASWEQAFPDAPVTAVAFHPREPDQIVVYAAGADLGLLVLEDGGASQRPAGFVLPGNDVVFHIAIHPENELVTYLGTAAEYLFKTTDGGQSWQRMAAGGTPLTDGS
jgi:hypothetical protein